MNYLTCCLTALTLPLFAQTPETRLPRVAPGAVDVSAEKLAIIDAKLQELVDQKKLAGVSVAAARGGKVFYFKTFGHADIDREKPVEENTIWRIYSMTKAITSTAVMMEWEKGKFKLEDPVSKFIPEFKNLTVVDGKNTQPATREMKVVDLLRHTSGLGYGLPGAHGKAWKNAGVLGRDQDLKSFTDKLSKLPLNQEPGTKWLYGTSIDVLGRLVEIWSGETFAVYLEKHIFKPLNMSDTAFYVPEEKVARFAASYHPGGKNLTVVDAPAKSRYLKNPAFASGGGGLCSTTEDYLKFLVLLERGGALFGNRLLKEKTVKLMTRNHLPGELMPIRFGSQKRWGIGFGLGFSVRSAYNKDWDPARKLNEFGWGGMASTHYWVSPDDDLCVVTMEQSVPFNFMTEWAVKQLFYDALE